MLLGFLMSDSMTGYELKKKFAISFSFFSGLSYGSIYPALRKMEQDGWITLKVEIQDGAPNRKVYTITDAGRKAFLEALRAPLLPERPKNAFLTRLFFFAHLPPQEQSAAANLHLDSIRGMQRALGELQPQIKGRADKYQYLCFNFGLRFFKDLVRNVSQVVRDLETDGPGPKMPSPGKETPRKRKGGRP